MREHDRKEGMRKGEKAVNARKGNKDKRRGGERNNTGADEDI